MTTFLNYWGLILYSCPLKRQTEKSKWNEMMGNGYAPIKFGKTKKHITEKEIESLILTISFVFIYMN